MAATDPFETHGKPALVEAVVEDIYDLDRVIAERDEKAPFTFRFGGEVYSLPPRPDMRAAAALSGGRLDAGFEMLLGKSQWERLQAAEAVFDDETLLAMMTAYQAHIGEDLGESKASQKSSRNTAKK